METDLNGLNGSLENRFWQEYNKVTMMNTVAERIRDKIKLLTIERQKLDQQINSLIKKDRQLKSDMHRIELKILIDSGLQSGVLFREANTLRLDKRELREHERTLRDLTIKLRAVVKSIETSEFWMKYANSDDPVKQAEAQRKVFG